MSRKEELTATQKMLVLGLRKTPLTERDQLAILVFTEDNALEQMALIRYLSKNPKASAQDILNALGRIMADERFRVK